MLRKIKGRYRRIKKKEIDPDPQLTAFHNSGALRRSILTPPMVNMPKKATLIVDDHKIDFFITSLNLDRSHAIIDVTDCTTMPWRQLVDSGAPTGIKIEGYMERTTPPDAPKPLLAPKKKPTGLLEDDAPEDGGPKFKNGGVCSGCGCANLYCTCGESEFD